MDDIVIGIDLGTTYCAVGYVDSLGTPRIVPNSEGQNTTPSVVLIDNDRIEVGELAMNQAAAKPDKIVRWIKRAMGDSEYRFQGMSAVEISSEILKKLKRDTEQAMGQSITQAVITCPAYFSSPEIRATAQAGKLAGFDVKEIVKEPTAAAVYYGVDHLSEGEILLVYDLGGGTFDATILALKNGVFTPLATAGDRRLGGHDWTMILVEYVCRKLSEKFGMDLRIDPIANYNVYEECERAKRNLSQTESAIISCVYQGRAEEVTVSRDEFNAMTEWRVEETLRWVDSVLHKFSPTATWTDIHKILLVGGATRMPRISQALSEVTGKNPIITGEADTMVALGAAVLAKGLVRPRTQDTALVSDVKKNALVSVEFERKASRNLGTKVISWRDGKPSVRNSSIIPYGTRLPARVTRSDYQTPIPGLRYFDCPVVEFDDIGPEVIVGTYRFACHPDTPVGTPISITFLYNGSGVAEVIAFDERARQELVSTEITFVPPDLSKLKAQTRKRVIIFVLDTSGSMFGDKLKQAKRALIESAESLSKSGGGRIQIGVVTFGSQANSLCKPTSDSSNISNLVNKIQSSGSTAMHLGIDRAVSMLHDVPNDVAREIALVSDGEPNDQSAALEAAERATSNGIKICAVGIGHSDVNEDFLHKIAPEVLTIEGVEKLGDALMTLLREASDQPNIVQWGGNR